MGILEEIVEGPNYGEIEQQIAKFMEDFLARTGARGYVIGLSGGVDSTAAAYLAVRAVGPERVHALLLPDREATPSEDLEDAKWVAEKLGISYTLVEINDIYESFLRSMPFRQLENKVANGNLKVRIRMCMLYYYANSRNCLVIGTSDRSEILIGYYTKWGDGASDLIPLGGLFKTQVRKLAEHMGVPKRIAYKPSSPRLWKGHMAEEELGASYEVIDQVLYCLFDKGYDLEETAKATGFSLETVKKIYEMYLRSSHKRSLPPAPELRW